MGRSVTEEGFEELYRATARDVLGYLRRRSPHNVEDLAAEVYTVAWRRRADLPAPYLRRAWLFGVARTLLAEDRRLERRHHDVVAELSANKGPVAPPETSQQSQDVLRDALQRLSANDQELLRLSAWENLTPMELTTVFGIRPATVRVRLHRARRLLAADPDVQSLVSDRPGNLAGSECL